MKWGPLLQARTNFTDSVIECDERTAAFCVPVIVAHCHVRSAGGDTGEQARLHALPQGPAQRWLYDVAVLDLCAIPSERGSRRFPSEYNSISHPSARPGSIDDGYRPSIRQNGSFLWKKAARTRGNTGPDTAFLKREAAPTCCFSASSARPSVLER